MGNKYTYNKDTDNKDMDNKDMDNNLYNNLKDSLCSYNKDMVNNR